MRFTLSAAKQLSADLERFSTDAINSYSNAIGTIRNNRSGGGWNDSKADEFDEIMQQMNNYMKKALQAVSDYHIHLKKKVVELEER